MRRTLTQGGIPVARFEPMTLADVKGVHAIERRSFTLPWTEGIFLAEVENRSGVSCPHVLRGMDGAILGYLCVWKITDELHINNVALAPEARGRGLGRMLMDCAEALARELGCAAMALEVRISNAQAIALYEKCGFVRVGTRKRYYEDTGEDALLMFRRLEAGS